MLPLLPLVLMLALEIPPTTSMWAWRPKDSREGKRPPHRRENGLRGGRHAVQQVNVMAQEHRSSGGRMQLRSAPSLTLWLGQALQTMQSTSTSRKMEEWDLKQSRELQMTCGVLHKKVVALHWWTWSESKTHKKLWMWTSIMVKRCFCEKQDSHKSLEQ